MVDHPPSVRYQEICIPLPKSTHLWTAGNEAERRRLQWNEPAGREKARFCFLVRDALDLDQRRLVPCHLTVEDYHLGLCSFQDGTWEAAHKAHSRESDELVTDPISREHVQAWRTQLDHWRAGMERECRLRENYFCTPPTSGAENLFAPLSLTLWHLLTLILYAPLNFLQDKNSTDEAKGKNKARLREWISCPCARAAVWNAAQICRVVFHESSSAIAKSRPSLNPLAIPGVVKSGIVACSYAHETYACPACNGGRSVDSINLFSADDGDAKLIGWNKQSQALAIWGPSGIPVCRCKVMELASWFRSALATDKGAEAEFASFLARLEKR